MLPAAVSGNSRGEKLWGSRAVLGWGGGRPSRKAKPPVLLPAAGRAAAAMGGRRSRLPALGMTQRWMKSCAAADGRGLQDMPSRRSPSARLSDGARVFPGERALCVSADAFEDSLRGTQGGPRSHPDPRVLRRGAVPEPCRRGGGCGVTCPGQPARSPARADGRSQAHPLPYPLPKPKSNYPSRRLSRPPQTQTIPLADTDKQPQPRFL